MDKQGDKWIIFYLMRNFKAIAVFVIVAGLFYSHVAFADTINIQSVVNGDLSGTISSHDYGNGYVGTFNQIYWYTDSSISSSSLSRQLGAELDTYSDNTYTGLRTGIYMQSGVGTINSGLVVSCLLSVDPLTFVSTTTTITFNGSEYLRQPGNSYLTSAFDPQMGDISSSTNRLIAFGLSYNSNCNVPSSGIFNSLTRIVTTSPVGVVATGSNMVGATLYVNSKDYVDGSFLQMSFTNQTLANQGGSALDAFNSAFGHIDIPITASNTLISLATSTDFSFVGLYRGRYDIVVPNTTFLIGQFLSGSNLVSTTTSFTVDHLTGLDIALASSSDALISALITGTTTQPVLHCNPSSSFDLQNCLISIVVPSVSVLQYDWDQFRSTIQSSFPFKYVFLLSGDLSSLGTTTIPALNYTFGSSSPAVLQGTTVNFQIYSDSTMGSSSPLLSIRADDGSNKNIWDIVDPYFTMIVAFAVFLVVLFDLLGIELHKHEEVSAEQKKKNSMFQRSVTNYPFGRK